MLQSKLPKVGTTIFSVMSQLAAEHGAVNLGQGFPDFPVPDRLVAELGAAMKAGHNQYAPMTGIAALREAIAGKTERVYGWRPDADREITVTSGASEAILDAIHAVVRAGEEVIVLDPCYDCYEPAIELAGATAVHVPLDPETFLPDWQRVRDAITPRTRMLMVNSPHNPSGAMLEDEQRLAGFHGEVERAEHALLVARERQRARGEQWRHALIRSSRPCRHRAGAPARDGRRAGAPVRRWRHARWPAA